MTHLDKMLPLGNLKASFHCARLLAFFIPQRARAFCLLLSAILLSANALAQSADDGWTTIRNGELWTDNNGNSVQAHGGNFLQVGDRWYLIGEDRSDPWRPDVNLYSTTDFSHWTFEGKIIQNGVTDKRLGKDRMIERPKLLYNEKTGKFIVWCHYESKDYSASEAACYESDNAAGPYSLVWSGRPLGIKSRDCNVFTDNDGKAYFISTTNENQDLGLFELSDDYTHAVSHTLLLPGDRREAPAMANVDGTYHMISSACTGWRPNQAMITTSADIRKGWLPLKNIGNRTAFRTQASSILTIKGSVKTTYIYVGDRWMDPDLPNSKTIMFPVEFNNGEMTFRNIKEWKLNIKTGETIIIEEAKAERRHGNNHQKR